MGEWASSKPVALVLLGTAAILAIVCLCFCLCTYKSTGPLEPVLGQWARHAEFVTYRGGSSAMVPNGQFWCMITGVLGVGAGFFGTLVFLSWRYQNNS